MDWVAWEVVPSHQCSVTSLDDRKVQVLVHSPLDGAGAGAGPPCAWVLVLVPCCGIGADAGDGAGAGDGMNKGVKLGHAGNGACDGACR